MSTPDPNGSEPSAGDAHAEPLAAGPWGAAPEEIAPIAPESRERADFRLYVDRNAGPYLRLFDAISAKEHGGSAFWIGFLVPQAWLLYRKLYGWAALACAIPVLAVAFHLNGEFGRAINYAPALIGLLGQRLYIDAARRTIARIRAMGLSEDETLENLKRAGGVSVAGAIVGGSVIAIQLGYILASALRAHH